MSCWRFYSPAFEGKKWSGFWEKKADRLFFSRLVCGFVVLFVEAKCWVIWFVLAPGEIENKNKFKDPLNDCACFFILHVPLGKRVGPPVGYQIKTYFTIWKKFQVYIVPLRCFLVSTDVISFWVSVQARYNWPGGVAYGCCERKLQRRLNWLLAILLLNTKMFIFLLLLTFDLSGGQKKGNGWSSPSQRRLRSVLGFTDDPEDMAVVAVVARPVSLMWVNNRCQDSSAPTPCPPGQNKTCSEWRVWKVLFTAKKYHRRWR